MGLKERRWKVVDWMHLAQDRNQWPAVLKTVKKKWGFMESGEFLAQLKDY
jgi:hypothetical protein